MNWPLMRNNIGWQEASAVGEFLGWQDYESFKTDTKIPRLTQGEQVASFEREFADWLGVKHAVMVNSGASANLITLAALKERKGDNDEIIVPTITWSSDIMSVLHAGFKPVFVDIDPRTLGMDFDQVFSKVGKYTKAVFVTHVLGFNAFTAEQCAILKAHHVEIIEDCCEATGATMEELVVDQYRIGKLGSFGLMSNFSFYYAHHMSTIEGGMVCTNSSHLNNLLRRLRSHGLVRETPDATKDYWAAQHPDLDPEFIFAECGFNVRSTEINAVIGRSQLKRLDANNWKRHEHILQWLRNLDENRYVTDYRTEGCSNYALPLVLREPNVELMYKVIACLRDSEVEFRRGTAGGGNQLRQPYLRRLYGMEYEKYPQAEHVHFYGLYIGNYPDLESNQIEELCDKLNAL